MALNRQAWLWGPVLAALLLLVALLPPRVPEEDRGPFPFVRTSSPVFWGGNAPASYRRDVQTALRVQQASVQHAALADSILAASRGPRALHATDGAVTLVYETPLGADSARFWLDAVTRELELYPRAGAAGMPLVVALLSDPARERGDVAWYWTVRELLDRAGSGHACIVTVNFYARAEWVRAATYVAHDASGRPVTRWLGACALYARFGAPGAAVERWAVGDARLWYQWYPLTTTLLEARRTVRRREVRNGLGSYDAPWWTPAWLAGSCLRGAPSPCLRAMGLETGDRDWYADATLSPARLLAFLLAAGAPERFAAFWHSAAPAASALATAYGAPAGTLVQDALRHWYEVPSPGGPRTDARTVLVGLAWALLAVWLGLVAGRRRQSAP